MVAQLGLSLRLQGNQRSSGSWLFCTPTSSGPSSRNGATLPSSVPPSRMLPASVILGR